MIRPVIALLSVHWARGFRAAWIPSSYNAASPAALCSQLQALQAVGFDRVYLDVFNNGVVYFNSTTVHAAGLGGAGGGVLGADRLRWATEECAGFHGDVFAWFEYGFMVQYGQAPTVPLALYAQEQGWVLGASGGFLWMDAASGATDFLASMLTDVVHDYPGCSGVQLDDHFAQPSELRSTAGSGSRLRSGVAMTGAALDVSRAVRRAVSTEAPGRTAPVTLSLAPTTLAQALHSFDVDWASWAAAGLFDEFVPQLYRSAYADFAPLLNATLASVPRVTAVGLRADGTGAPTPWPELEQMYDEVEHTRGVSSSLWNSRGALELYPRELATYFAHKA